jgi:hypothetical protein
MDAQDAQRGYEMARVRDDDVDLPRDPRGERVHEGCGETAARAMRPMSGTEACGMPLFIASP